MQKMLKGKTHPNHLTRIKAWRGFNFSKNWSFLNQIVKVYNIRIYGFILPKNSNHSYTYADVQIPWCRKLLWLFFQTYQKKKKKKRLLWLNRNHSHKYRIYRSLFWTNRRDTLSIELITNEICFWGIPT